MPLKAGWPEVCPACLVGGVCLPFLSFVCLFVSVAGCFYRVSLAGCCVRLPGLCALLSSWDLCSTGVCVSGDTHWVVCMCTWAFTCLCVGCKCSWICLLWPVVGVFTLRLLRDVQLSLATSEPQFPHLLHGDNSNTPLVELL